MPSWYHSELAMVYRSLSPCQLGKSGSKRTLNLGHKVLNQLSSKHTRLFMITDVLNLSVSALGLNEKKLPTQKSASDDPEGLPS